jgi:hypothetical protein
MTEYPELVDMLGNVSIIDDKDKKIVYDDVNLKKNFF